MNWARYCRIQEQKLKMELELQLLRLSDEAHSAHSRQGHSCEGVHHPEDAHDEWMHHGLSRASSANLEQPGTPEQHDQEAASEQPSHPNPYLPRSIPWAHPLPHCRSLSVSALTCFSVCPGGPN